MACLRAEVQALIASNPVVVFSKTDSPPSFQLKALFDKIGAKYTTIEVDMRAGDSDLVQQELGNRTCGKTEVPLVFINGKFIGGWSDIAAMNNRHLLIPLLREASAIQAE